MKALTAYFYVNSNISNKIIPKNKFQNVSHAIRNKLLPADHTKRFWYRSSQVVSHTQATKSQGLQHSFSCSTNRNEKNLRVFNHMI
jgi:hypothetical protein